MTGEMLKRVAVVAITPRLQVLSEEALGDLLVHWDVLLALSVVLLCEHVKKVGIPTCHKNGAGRVYLGVPILI